MTTPFDALAEVAGATVDVFAAEGFTLSPRKRPDDDANARSVADPDRAEAAFRAIFVEPSERGFLDSRAHADSAASAIVSTKPAIDFPVSALLYAIAEGDRVTREKTGQAYDVAEVHPDGFGRVRATLNARKVA